MFCVHGAQRAFGEQAECTQNKTEPAALAAATGNRKGAVAVFIFCSEKNLKFFSLKNFRRPSGGIFINYYESKEHFIVVWLPQAKILLYIEFL